jgi:hypothetical protein
MTARTMRPPGRDAYEVIRDFNAAANRLATISADWKQGQFRAGDLIDAASTVEGLRALLAELRVLEGGE